LTEVTGRLKLFGDRALWRSPSPARSAGPRASAATPRP